MYNNIPKLQTGAYIPGLSSSVFQAGLSRDIAKTQGDLRSLGRNIKRKQKSSKLFGSLGKLLGKGGMKFLTKGLMASNPLLGLALNAAGSAGGKYLGAKLGYGKKSKIDNDSELLGSQFEDLSDFESGISKEIAGESVADFGTEFAKGLKSEYGQDIMNKLNARKQQKFAKNVTEQGLEDNPFLAEQFDDVFDVEDGVPIDVEGNPINIMGSLSESTPEDVLVDPKSLPLSSINKVTQTTAFKASPKMPNASLLGKLNQSAKTNLFSNRGNEIKRGLARSFGIGGDEFATRTTARGLMDNPFLQSEEDDSLYDLYDNTPSVQNALLGLSNTVSQYNTPGMAHGGYVPEKGFGGLIQYRKGY